MVSIDVYGCIPSSAGQIEPPDVRLVVGNHLPVDGVEGPHDHGTDGLRIDEPLQSLALDERRLKHPQTDGCDDDTARNRVSLD